MTIITMITTIIVRLTQVGTGTEACVSLVNPASVVLIDDFKGCPGKYKHVCWAGELSVIESTTVCCDIGGHSCELVDVGPCPAKKKWVCDAGGI